jgi:uncharacterized membrane protein YdbT with pleckstrin-like domain
VVRFPRFLEPVQGEKSIWYGRRSVKCMLGPLITFFLLLLLTVALGSGPPPAQAVAGFLAIIDVVILIILIINMIRILSTEYFISNYRVFVRYGIIRREIYEVRHEWISNYTIRQGFMDRLLNRGDLVIGTPGHYKGYVEMRCVSNPIALKDLLENVLQKYRRWEDVRNRLRRLEEEFEFGRVDQARYTELKNKYQEELEKIWD